MIKIRKLIFDYEKEEQWLNKMSQQGFAFVKYKSFAYYFEPCTPGEFIYRIELLDSKPDTEESKAYLEFSKELGIEIISQTYNWVYFRKPTNQGPFLIHSDINSKINHHKKIMHLQGFVALANLIIGVANLILGYFNGFSQYISLLSFSVAALLGYLFLLNFKKVSKLQNIKLLKE